MTWYVDNTSAMASFVKGASANVHLEQLVGLTHLFLFKLDCQVWWEWVDSGANWADGPSRLYAKDPVAIRLGFRVEPMGLHQEWWTDAWCEVWARADRLG